MPGLSAAEAGPRPPCECHELPMRWNRRADLTAGGYWRCVVLDRANQRRQRELHPERFKARNRAWQEANVEHRRAYQRNWRYGMKQGEYTALVEAHGDLCGICGVPAAQSAKGVLHIDHDHATGKVRGLLCHRCNSALERLDAVEDWTTKAVAYLSK